MVLLGVLPGVGMCVTRGLRDGSWRKTQTRRISTPRIKTRPRNPCGAPESRLANSEKWPTTTPAGASCATSSASTRLPCTAAAPAATAIFPGRTRPRASTTCPSCARGGPTPPRRGGPSAKAARRPRARPRRRPHTGSQQPSLRTATTASRSSRRRRAARRPAAPCRSPARVRPRWCGAPRSRTRSWSGTLRGRWSGTAPCRYPLGGCGPLRLPLPESGVTHPAKDAAARRDGGHMVVDGHRGWLPTCCLAYCIAFLTVY